eukprot:12782085-Alexandrium_andersonii.AAC.1
MGSPATLTKDCWMAVPGARGKCPIGHAERHAPLSTSTRTSLLFWLTAAIVCGSIAPSTQDPLVSGAGASGRSAAIGFGAGVGGVAEPVLGVVEP